MIGPYFAQLSLQYTNVIFLKVDVDKVKPVAQKHGISAMPTFLFFKNQQKVHEFKGANPDNLNRALQSLTGFSSLLTNTNILRRSCTIRSCRTPKACLSLQKLPMQCIRLF